MVLGGGVTVARGEDIPPEVVGSIPTFPTKKRIS
jgi:hypothetical protein